MILVLGITSLDAANTCHTTEPQRDMSHTHPCREWTIRFPLTRHASVDCEG